MFNILMIGPLGAGKGTQSERLSNKLGIPTISVGQLFRTEIENKTGLGQAIVEYIGKGDPVPDLIVDQLMAGRLSEEDTEQGVILDGYPGNMRGQQEKLDDIFKGAGRKLTGVIFLRVGDDEVVRRISGRLVCSNSKCGENYHTEFNPPKKTPGKCDRCGSELYQRADDSAETVRHRLDLYHRDTKPLIDYYRDRGMLIEIDGAQSIEKVESDIHKALGL